MWMRSLTFCDGRRLEVVLSGSGMPRENVADIGAKSMSKIDDAGVLVVGGCDAGRGAGMDQVYCTQGAFDRSDLLAEDAGGEGKIEECSESWSLVLNLSFVDDFGVFAEDLDAVQSDDEVMVALAKVVDTFGKGFSGSPAVIGSRIATDRHRTTSYHVWLPVYVTQNSHVSPFLESR